MAAIRSSVRKKRITAGLMLSTTAQPRAQIHKCHSLVSSHEQQQINYHLFFLSFIWPTQIFPPLVWGLDCCQETRKHFCCTLAYSFCVWLQVTTGQPLIMYVYLYVSVARTASKIRVRWQSLWGMCDSEDPTAWSVCAFSNHECHLLATPVKGSDRCMVIKFRCCYTLYQHSAIPIADLYRNMCASAPTVKYRYYREMWNACVFSIFSAVNQNTDCLVKKKLTFLYHLKARSGA